jgi:hypothetical protein
MLSEITTFIVEITSQLKYMQAEMKIFVNLCHCLYLWSLYMCFICYNDTTSEVASAPGIILSYYLFIKFIPCFYVKKYEHLNICLYMKLSTLRHVNPFF